MVATGTCSSTGYSANYGPVPTCPSGTGWWFAFVFGGIIGGLAGALMAGSLGLVFAGIFGGIGFGSLSILLDSHTQSSEKIFAGIFGGCFALVGVVTGVGVIASAIGSLRATARKTPTGAPTPATTSGIPQPATAFGTPQAAAAFGTDSKHVDPILAAYDASRSAAASVPNASQLLNLAPGLQAARHVAAGDSLDELAKLGELHKKGVLTDEEFANAKAKLLGQM